MSSNRDTVPALTEPKVQRGREMIIKSSLNKREPCPQDKPQATDRGVTAGTGGRPPRAEIRGQRSRGQDPALGKRGGENILEERPGCAQPSKPTEHRSLKAPGTEHAARSKAGMMAWGQVARGSARRRGWRRQRKPVQPQDMVASSQSLLSKLSGGKGHGLT